MSSDSFHAGRRTTPELVVLKPRLPVATFVPELGTLRQPVLQRREVDDAGPKPSPHG